MPKSKVRDKVRKQKKVAPAVEQFAAEDEKLESPSWLAPVMVANFILGLIWIVIFYISGGGQVHRPTENISGPAPPPDARGPRAAGKPPCP